MEAYYLKIEYILNGQTVGIHRDMDCFQIFINGQPRAVADSVKDAEHIVKKLLLTNAKIKTARTRKQFHYTAGLLRRRRKP